MQGKIYGYARVSTMEQNEARQMAAIRRVGTPEGNIYVDKISGKDFCRPQYQKWCPGFRRGICFIS